MTATQDRPATEIGKDRRRKEDQRLITGRTRWTDNITLPGMLHLAMVRSPFAHATITSIDVEAAKASPNVVTVLTGKDFGDELGVCINAWPITPDQKTPTHSPMPADRVAFAGEVVAVVVARSAAEARDAAELVDVEYDELPAVIGIKKALEDEVLAHPDLGTNKSALWVFDSDEAGTGGDVEAAIEDARANGILIEREYRQQRLIPAFMEPRSVVVDPTGEQLTMWSATQIPHILRFALAATTGVPESKIRVIAPDVGGGFGGKLQVTPEEWIAWAVARRLTRPVKYTETRSESLMAAHHGRDQVQTLTLAADKEGNVTALKVHLDADLGAYIALVGGGVPVLGAFMFNAIYKFPAYRFECQTVLTNTTFTDAYRGAGRPEATYAIERLMDELAAEVGVDPLEIRERNWITHEEFPFTTVAGLEYDSGNYEAATARAKESFGYDALRAEQKVRRDRGTGCSSASASRPSPRCAASRRAGCWAASTTAPAAGSTRACGCSPPARWRSSPARVPTARATRRRSARSSPTASACRSRTSRCCTATPRSHTAGSTPTARARSWSAGRRWCRPSTRSSTRPGTSPRTCSRPARTTSTTPTVGSPSAAPTRASRIQELATATFTGHNYPDDMELSIDAEATYDPVNFNYPHGTHLCAMEVDTETGAVKMRKYTCCDDIGTIINPLIVAGQVHGGLVQGIAQALWEEAVHDEAGTLVSGSFVDYLLPTSADTISFDVSAHPRAERLHDQLARHEGRRRGRHHRLDPGCRQRGRRRHTAPRRRRHPDALHPRAGVARDPRQRR